MRTYHPASWSSQARELCANIIISAEYGYITIDDAFLWFGKSYRAPLIRRRAAKRFGRLWRSGKIHPIQK